MEPKTSGPSAVLLIWGHKKNGNRFETWGKCMLSNKFVNKPKNAKAEVERYLFDKQKQACMHPLGIFFSAKKNDDTLLVIQWTCAERGKKSESGQMGAKCVVLCGVFLLLQIAWLDGDYIWWCRRSFGDFVNWGKIGPRFLKHTGFDIGLVHSNVFKN